MRNVWVFKLLLTAFLLEPIAFAQMGFMITGQTACTPTPHSQTDRAIPESVTIPAGTHLLLRLTSALHTTSATAGAGVYLETTFPVVVGDRIAIPAHTRVFGLVERGRRPGRVRGRAQLQVRFTQFAFPDNRVFAMTGSLQSLPGSSLHRAVDREGTIEPVDQIDADVYVVAKAAGAGVLFGAVTRIGIGPGAAILGSVAVAKVLFTRGDPIFLPVGTEVEMVLQRPLTVELRPDNPSHHQPSPDPESNLEVARR